MLNNNECISTHSEGWYETTALDLITEYDAYYHTDTLNNKTAIAAIVGVPVSDGGVVGVIRVDTATGEVLGRYEYVDTAPYTKKDYERDYKIVPSPYNAKNPDDIEDYITLQRKNRNKIVVGNDFTKYATEAAGRWHYGDIDSPPLSKSAYNILKKLCAAVKIHNVIVATRAEVAEVLGIHPNHLQRTFRVVEPHIRVFNEKDGMSKGFIKIAISPHFIFAAAGNSFYQQREAAMKAWYCPRPPVVAKKVKWVQGEDGVHQEHFDAYLKGRNPTKRKFTI